MDKKRLITILIAVGVLALCIGGYFLIKETFLSKEESNGTEEAEDTTSDDEDDELVDIDVNTHGGSWNSDIPSSIPEFKQGSIQTSSSGESSSTKSWMYIFENVDEDDFDDYKDDLTDAGFTNISSYTVDNDSVIMVTKSPYTILVTYSSDEETIGLSITEVLE